MATFKAKPARGDAQDTFVYLDRLEAPAKGQKFYFDDHRDAPRGFGLRLTQAGGKAFVLKYTIDGRQRRMTIGDYPTWSIESARTEARELRKQIDAGTDPLAVKDKRKTDPTVGKLVEDYLERHAAGLPSERDIKRYLKGELGGDMGNVKVREVRRRDIIELVEGKAATAPTAARQLLVYTKGFFDWCVDREYIEYSPAAGIKPKNISPAGRKNALKPVKRLRVLSADEIADFWNKVEDSGIQLATALALKLVLLTGQRPGEVAGMHADEIDGKWWTIPASRRRKTETENRVPLTPEALAIIERAKAEAARLGVRRGEPSGYVFEARRGSPITAHALPKAVARHGDAFGNQKHARWGFWTPHDLRRTCRTGLSACGFPAEIAERVIGHGGAGIEAVYNQHSYDPERRAALEAWERRLLTIAKGGNPEDATVVPIRRGAA